MMDAIQWRWPGAQCVVSGNVVTRWDGPMARPTDAEIAQADLDFAAQNIAGQQKRDREIAAKVIQALALATHQRFKAQIPADPTTLAQWKASIVSAYDSLP